MVEIGDVCICSSPYDQALGVNLTIPTVYSGCYIQGKSNINQQN